jgi:N-acetyl-anhydromuramyl-L-alanine amidase AmpD
MSDIIIAGRRRPLSDPSIRVVTFLDPGGLSFYQGSGPGAEARVSPDPDTGDLRPLLRPRPRPAGAPPAALGLQGMGWDTLGGGDPLSALRRVVRAVVLHHDGSPSSKSCYDTLVQRALSSHFMIERDGSVWQATDVADMAWHAQGMNATAVGFDLNSTAPNLLRQPDAQVPYGAQPSAQAVINGLPIQSWTYSEEQYRSLIAILRVLVDDLGLEPVFPLDQDGGILRTVLADPPPEQFSGILCHWHSEESKWDPGPGLDWERILAGLRKEDATFPVMPAVTDPGALADDAAERALVTGGAFAGPDATRKALEPALGAEEGGARFLRLLARACERESGGGYFPVGVNQTWHGGIHVPCAAGTAVVPLLKGELVAAHLGGADAFPRGLGSNNFVLMRHRIPLPPRPVAGGSGTCATGADAAAAPEQVDEARRNDLTVFTLYMHLDAVDWNAPPQTGIFRKLPASRRDLPTPPPPAGPTLEAASPKEFPDPVAALRAGYVALFSPADKPEAAVVLNTGDVLGLAGEFGDRTGDRRVVHVEVFADDRYAEALDLALCGRYLVPGEDDPGRDLVVRARPLLEALGWESRPRKGASPKKGDVAFPATGKVLSAEDVRRFFAEAGEAERAALRRLIVRHVSEWSDRVDWIRTLLASQEWRGLLADERAARGLFAGEAARWLRFCWLTDAVAAHAGIRFRPGQEGVLAHFHPINFLAWWLYLRSAVRGKPLEDLLRCLEGRKASVGDGVPEVLGDFLDLPGQGEWEHP